MNDPIIEEIHQVRKRHAEKFGNDINRIFDELRKREKSSGYKIVSRERT